MKERRTKTRFDVCLTARWQGSTTQSLRISDLSQGGCYVDTIIEVTAGETLFLEILMPDGERTELEGVVAHHFPQLGFGVRFVNLNEEKHHQIRSLLRMQHPGFAESPDTSACRETLIPSPSEQIDFTSRGIM